MNLEIPFMPMRPTSSSCNQSNKCDWSKAPGLQTVIRRPPTPKVSGRCPQAPVCRCDAGLKTSGRGQQMEMSFAGSLLVGVHCPCKTNE